MKSIVLNKITQKEIENGTRIEFELDIGDKPYEMYYNFHGVDCTVGKLPELFDGVAVTFLPYALRYGYDLKSSYPMSEDLYYSLNYQVIPHLYACNKDKAYEISVTAPVTKEVYDGKWNGAGVSCGVDSLASIYEYLDPKDLPDYKLTHLLYLRVGQHAERSRFVPEEEAQHFSDGLQNAIGFAREVGLGLVVGESNYHLIAAEAFGYETVPRTFTYRNLGSVLYLQNHFSKYFYASSHGDLNHFKVDLTGDVAFYERWLMPLIGTSSVKFYMASKSMERIEKTALITRYPSSYNHLSVCWLQEKNCGYCSKCVRTLLTLDMLGELDNYKNVFDLDFYRRRKKDYMAYAWFRWIYGRLGLKTEEFMAEIADYMAEQQHKKPPLVDIFILCLKRLQNWTYPYVKDAKKK